MFNADLTRHSAALWLAAIDLFTTPLRVVACSQAVVGDDQQRTLQEEVWNCWCEQPDPLTEVIFPT